jgi:hypothetical protein
MLKIMEDEQKIFRAWLYKIVKKDKTITGRKLAKKIGVKEPTLTAYHSGRKDETGEKKFPVIPIDKRNAILSVTKTSDKEMMEAGRQEIVPPQNIDQKIEAKVDAKFKEYTANIQTATGQLKTNGDIIDFKNPDQVRHHQLLNKFPNTKEALEMNELALEYVQKDPNAIKELIKYIKYQMSQIEGDGDSLGEANTK